MLSSVDILSRVIIEDATTEAQAVLAKARKDSAAIMEEGLQIIEELRKKERNGEAHIEISFNKTKQIALAEFKSRSEILGRKEEIVSGIIKQLRQEFFALPQRKDYPLVLKGLIINALSHLEKEGNSFVCRVNSRDYSVLSSDLDDLIKKTDKGLSVDKTPIDISGGVIVFRSDQRVFYDNSLEAIFERKISQLRCIAAECIFG